ncbi:MAG: hypothetical protein J0I29_15595 [Rhizobiales bacterium]|nr:hypothetical protein [Hyphomicrobiales bacterium]
MEQERGVFKVESPGRIHSVSRTLRGTFVKLQNLFAFKIFCLLIMQLARNVFRRYASFLSAPDNRRCVKSKIYHYKQHLNSNAPRGMVLAIPLTQAALGPPQVSCLRQGDFSACSSNP